MAFTDGVENEIERNQEQERTGLVSNEWNGLVRWSSRTTSVSILFRV